MKLILIAPSLFILLAVQQKCATKSPQKKSADNFPSATPVNVNIDTLKEAYFDSATNTYIDPIKNFNPDTMQNPPDPSMIKFDNSTFIRQIDSLTKLIESNPKDASLYVERGNLNIVIGNSSAACEDWREAKKLGNKSIKISLEKNCE